MIGCNQTWKWWIAWDMHMPALSSKKGHWNQKRQHSEGTQHSHRIFLGTQTSNRTNQSSYFSFYCSNQEEHQARKVSEVLKVHKNDCQTRSSQGMLQVDTTQFLKVLSYAQWCWFHVSLLAHSIHKKRRADNPNGSVKHIFKMAPLNSAQHSA